MKKQLTRYFAVFMVLNLIFEIASPSVALALTNGPIQPEFIGFEPANTSEMVDLFTGDFKYNIPLMDVDGYPLNLSYHAGANMESEASWVGLGWSLNPGVMNRMVKGLPDDFNGDEMKTETRIKPHVGMGVGYQKSSWFGAEVTGGAIGAGAQIGVNAAIVLVYNNYKGFGIETQFDGNATMSGNVGSLGGFSSAGVGMSLNSQDGGVLSYQTSFGVGYMGLSKAFGEGTSINTRSGAMTKTVFSTQSVGIGVVSISKTTSHTLPSGPISYSPKIANDFESTGFGLSVKLGLWGCVTIPLPPVTPNIKGGILKGFKGFYSKTELKSTSKTSKSYGYLYLEGAGDNDVMDFNRFKDGVLTEETPNAPIANKTYDNYSAVAQGMSSNFRPFRSDIGAVHDPHNYSFGVNTPIATENGAGVFLHSLTDVLSIVNSGESGNWNNFIGSTVSYNAKDISLPENRYYEKAYFKQYGELTARTNTFDIALGEENTILPALSKVGSVYEAASSGGLSGSIRDERDIRATNINYLISAQADAYGYEKNIKLYDINSGQHDVNPTTRMVNYTGSPISRLTKSVPGNSSYSVNNHISEISLTNSIGYKYIYGIPAYNLSKKRVLFNASSRTEPAYQANGYPTTSYSQNALKKSNTHQLVEYDPTTDLANNKRGADNLYTADETPAYANSYLLTTILSTDYMDVTQDGPTYDDLGNFTKFNYSKTTNYQWREPFGAPTWATNGTRGSISSNVVNQANFDKGLIADQLDDKAFYEYGVRENYYLQSIETKNHVAFFECSLREDFNGVTDEAGTPASTPTNYKLDRIKLYSKSEILAKGKALAVPLKTVNFEYNYALCPKTFNSNETTSHGKLTLQKVYFTYGNSQKGSLSPYDFFYGDNNHDGSTDASGNPEYNTKAVDRWGTYKPNATNSGDIADITPDIGEQSKLNNIEFPYSEQDEDLANQYSVAWNLTRIITPSNAIIEITYEADDYGYVQNELAGQMLMINNARDVINPLSDTVSSYPVNSNLIDANYVIVDLQKLNVGIPVTMPLAQANAVVQKNMFRPESDLYYKCFIKLAGPANSFGLNTDYYDYVPGYATIQDAGLYTPSITNNVYSKNSINYYKYAYVRLQKDIAYGSTEVNPISLAGWEYTRSFLPRIAYPGSEPANMGDNSHEPKEQFKNMINGLGVAMIDFVAGVSDNPNFRFHYRKFCNEMDFSKSFVRSYVPFKKKKGGGYRVKQLITKDNWNTMTTNSGGSAYSERASVYGQKFNYSRIDDDNTTEISSGVAYYEPIQGGDEISLRKPIKFSLEKKMAPNDHLFQEEPYCEMLYPAPLVGYSKVTVTPVADNNSSLYRIGRSVFEFYTAKDYPIIESRSKPNKELDKNDIIEDFSAVKKAYKIFYMTQGHVLKLNDMHGKLKAINTFGEDNLSAPISGASYTYKDAAYNDNSRQLITEAKTLSERNVISTEQIARDIDITVDNRKSMNNSTTSGKSIFLELSLCSPFMALHVGAIDGTQETGLKTSVTTKIIQQYGILEKSEVFDDKSRTLSENLLWDRNTGNVLLSKTTNNLAQPVYSFNYPAYWMYPKMGSEFKREGIVIKIPSGSPLWNLSSGSLDKVSFVNPDVIAIGDEVVVFESGSSIINGKKYWVTYDQASFIGPPTNYDHNYCLVDADGIILNTTTASGLNTGVDHYIKIIRPAERNQIAESAGSVSALTIPSISGGSGFNVTQKIISADMQTWCSGWNAYLKDDITQQQTNCLDTNFNKTPTTEKRFNPYTTGVLGNWRPFVTYKHNVNRDYSSTQANVKSDGTFSSYSPFWVYYGSPYYFWLPSAQPVWVRTNTNNVYSPYGYLMENKDALGIYHAQRFGFNHTLPILSASNARVREVGFESFEDYQFYHPSINACNIFSNNQLDFYNQIVLTGSTKPLVTSTSAHTGRYSLNFTPSQGISLTHYINKTPTPYTIETSITTHDFVNICGDDPALNKLSMVPGKYIISFWIKKTTPAMSYSSDFTFGIETKNGTGSWTTLTPNVKQSNIVNGWQKFDYEFTIPSSPSFSGNSKIRFNMTAVNNIYMDDFRVQPFNSTMTCTVYDPYQMRIWAQLDDNNYATILEYDNDGTLVSKKKETMRGIYTTQEIRQGSVKRN